VSTSTPRPLLRLEPGQAHTARTEEFVIREEHAIEDVLGHLIVQCNGDRGELLAILESMAMPSEAALMAPPRPEAPGLEANTPPLVLAAAGTGLVVPGLPWAEEAAP